MPPTADAGGVAVPRAGQFRLDDYRAVEMPHCTVEWARVPVPNSFGMDLPAGASAAELAPTDYRIVEIGDHLPR